MLVYFLLLNYTSIVCLENHFNFFFFENYFGYLGSLLLLVHFNIFCLVLWIIVLVFEWGLYWICKLLIYCGHLNIIYNHGKLFFHFFKSCSSFFNSVLLLSVWISLISFIKFILRVLGVSFLTWFCRFCQQSIHYQCVKMLLTFVQYLCILLLYWICWFFPVHLYLCVSAFCLSLCVSEWEREGERDICYQF